GVLERLIEHVQRPLAIPRGKSSARRVLRRGVMLLRQRERLRRRLRAHRLGGRRRRDEHEHEHAERKEAHGDKGRRFAPDLRISGAFPGPAGQSPATVEALRAQRSASTLRGPAGAEPPINQGCPETAGGTTPGRIPGGRRPKRAPVAGSTPGTMPLPAGATGTAFVNVTRPKREALWKVPASRTGDQPTPAFFFIA